jgi:hypothetical protein
MHLNDMPFCLLYTASTLFSGPPFLTKLVPKPTEPRSEFFDYTYYQFTGEVRTIKGKQVKIKRKLPVPGHMNGMPPAELFVALGADFAEFKNTIGTIVQFDLRWNEDGTLEYQRKGRWVKSLVTKTNIMEYFNDAEQAEKEKRLPARPAKLGPSGEEKNYTDCDYCSLSEVCNKYESQYDVWMKIAKETNW